MKILMITNILTPYRIKFYDDLNNVLKKQGSILRVLVLAETEPNRSWKYDDFKRDYTELADNININLKGDIFINFTRKINIYLLKYSPDVIIIGGSYLNPNIFNILKYSKKNLCSVYFWSESHLDEEKNYNKIKKWIRHIIRSFIIKKINNFCVPGKLAQDFILKYSKKDSNFIFLPNLIDNEYYFLANRKRMEESDNIKRKYNLNDNKFIFLLPARLTPVKGILEFLEIYRLCKENINATILIAGEGELKKSIEEKIDLYDIDVRILGSKTQEEMLELYSIANCLLLPSLSDPNPLSCIEAIWSGLPLLVSNKVGNYPEVIYNGKNGFVFNYNEVEETISIINRLIMKESKWMENASKISLQIAEKRFNSNLCINKFIEDLKLSNKNRGAK
ncbi:glycosyltransferase family 4 protein [Clostridium perfringens]